MSTELVDKLATELEIPEGVTVTYKKPMITVQGPLGKTWKSFKKIPVTIEVTDGKVLFKAQGTRNKNRAIMNTSRSLIRNLCEGVVEGYTIKMKIVFSHFQTSPILGDAPALLYSSSVSETNFSVCSLNSLSKANYLKINSLYLFSFRIYRLSLKIHDDLYFLLLNHFQFLQLFEKHLSKHDL